MKENKIKALKAAFPYTLPIMAGFLFLGTAYGIFARTEGLAAFYPIIMALLVFAGSMEFVAVNLLTGIFDPLNALLLTIMVNARHLFYGISMMEKYREVDRKKRWYLIFGMCDRGCPRRHRPRVVPFFRDAAQSYLLGHGGDCRSACRLADTL